MRYDESVCKGPWLHRFVLRRQREDWSEEVCAICHLRKFFKVRNGRVDNYKYLKTHLRQALQPWHNRFVKEYGNTLKHLQGKHY